MKSLLLSLAVFLPLLITAQSLYFPPLAGDEWETVDPASLGWCTENIDSVLQYAEDKNTKALIVLKDGRIALEHYFGSFTQDSIWYWASAGKTITAMLAGIAQQEGYLSLDDPASDYLGAGWTDCTPDQEEQITIWHQLTMTSGLDDGVDDPFCTLDTCLVWLADPGTRWAYHNAPYTLLHDVLAEATGLSPQLYTYTRLSSKIGMNGLWLPSGYNSVYFSRPRDMARFGLLILNNGVWDQTVVLDDADYFYDMTHSSQDLNKSYGYLWWLNGQGSHMLPGSQIVLQSDLMPDAPADLIAGLGKNDQKVYVVPSEGLVVIRMGESSGTIPIAALSGFDNELWKRLMDVIDCAPNSTAERTPMQSMRIVPNPGQGAIQLPGFEQGLVRVLNSEGRVLWEGNYDGKGMNLSHLPAGLYFVQGVSEKGVFSGKWVRY
jgi:CubicO group peptidase (beta-lactamase class C family)